MTKQDFIQEKPNQTPEPEPEPEPIVAASQASSVSEMSSKKIDQ